MPKKRHSYKEITNWRNLRSGGGKHELPDVEPPAKPGQFYFFDNADQPGSPYSLRSAAQLA